MISRCPDNKVQWFQGRVTPSFNEVPASSIGVVSRKQFSEY